MVTIENTVPFQDPQGNFVSNGYLTLILSAAAKISGGGGQVAPSVVSILLDDSGQIPASTMLWANDELLPSGTTYLAQLYNSTDSVLATLGEWSITGASPIDLSQITPT